MLFCLDLLGAERENRGGKRNFKIKPFALCIPDRMLLKIKQ